MDDAYLRNKRIDVNQVVERILRNLLMPGFDDHEKMSPGDIVVASDLARGHGHAQTQPRARLRHNLGGPISLPTKSWRAASAAFRRSSRCTTPRAMCAQAGLLIVTAPRYHRRAGQAPDRPVYQRQKDIALREKARTQPPATESRDHARDRHAVTLLITSNCRRTSKRRSGRPRAHRFVSHRFLFMNRPTPPTEEERFRAYGKWCAPCQPARDHHPRPRRRQTGGRRAGERHRESGDGPLPARRA